jgi:hypothetical protein
MTIKGDLTKTPFFSAFAPELQQIREKSLQKAANPLLWEVRKNAFFKIRIARKRLKKNVNFYARYISLMEKQLVKTN